MLTNSKGRQQSMVFRADQNINQIKFKQKNLMQRQQQSRSIIKQKTIPKLSSSRNGVFAKSASVKDQIRFYLESAKVSKQKIYKGLEFVKTIQNYNQDQRCLEHNNVITLYCMNDRKLLCVYCIYGVDKHRNHKLLPAAQNLKSVAQDVAGLQQKYNQYLIGLDDVILNSKSYTQFFQNLMKKYLAEIQVQYMKRKLELQDTYEKEKNYIIKSYEQIIETASQISNEYEQIKFNIWEYQARYNLDKKQKSSMNLELQNDDKSQTGQSKAIKQDKQNINKSRSLSKKTFKKQNQQLNRQQSVIKKKSVLDQQKDYRQILSKHVVLSHIVEQMKKIQPVKIDQKNIEKRVLNKSNLKLIAKKDNSLMKNMSKQKSISKLK